MDSERLRLFLKIVSLGTMSAASRAVHLTQPAVSRNIQLLEDALGAQLFVRDGRRLVLTPAGRALVPRAEALLAHEDALRFEIGRTAQRDYNDVRLGAVDSVATFMIPRIVDSLHREYPELAVKLTTARTATLLERIRKGALDLAVVAYSGRPPDVESRAIAPYDLQFYGDKRLFPALTQVRELDQLKRFPIVEIEPAPGTSGLVPDDARSYAVASNVASVKALVLSGLGVGELPDYMLSAHDRKGLARAKVQHDPDCALFLVTASGWRSAAETRMADAIMKWLAQAVKGAKS